MLFAGQPSEFIARFTEWAETETWIDAVALVGSHARGIARADSDVDLILLTTDPATHLANTAWVETFGTPSSVKQEDDGAVQSLRVVYVDGLKVEFGLTTVRWADASPADPGSAQIIRAGTVALIDKSQRLEELTRSVVGPGVIIRDLEDGDSIQALTELLHRACRPLLDMGLRYCATRQTEEDTRKRISTGQCLVATMDGGIVGTATYHFPSQWQDSPWVTRQDVAVVGQFAVEPELQQKGIGSALMERVEEIAKQDGAAELALSTAEPATCLVDYYTKRGYRFIEYTDATLSQGYRSVIMSKTI